MADWQQRNHAHLTASRLARGKAGDQEAYLAAMQKAQDTYYDAGGQPCGLLRHGPRQERLSTKQYAARIKRAEQSAKVARKLEDEATKLEQADEKLSVTRQEIIKAAAEREAELDARGEALDAKEEILTTQQSDLHRAFQALDSVMTAMEEGHASENRGNLRSRGKAGFLGGSPWLRKGGHRRRQVLTWCNASSEL